MEDFASLLKSLWSQEYLCIFPSKFKRGLIKYKPQFAGNEQQDSQVLLCNYTGAAALAFSFFHLQHSTYFSLSGEHMRGGWFREVYHCIVYL